MASVNDLQDQWDCDYLQLCEDGEISIAGGVSRCSHDLRDLARTAWHPVSSRDDAKEVPQETVLMRNIDGGVVMDWGPNLLANWDIYTHWARIRDVVLIPPED